MNQTSHGSQSCQTHWNYESCCVGSCKTKWVMAESSDKTWSTGEGNGKPLHYSWLENLMNSMKRQKEMTLKDELLRSIGVQYVTGEKWRNRSRRDREAEPKHKQCSVVDVSGGEVKSNVLKNNIALGTCNVRSMNQGKLEVVKQRWQEWTLTF